MVISGVIGDGGAAEGVKVVDGRVVAVGHGHGAKEATEEAEDGQREHEPEPLVVFPRLVRDARRNGHHGGNGDAERDPSLLRLEFPHAIAAHARGRPCAEIAVVEVVDELVRAGEVERRGNDEP